MGTLICNLSESLNNLMHRSLCVVWLPHGLDCETIRFAHTVEAGF